MSHVEIPQELSSLVEIPSSLFSNVNCKILRAPQILRKTRSTSANGVDVKNSGGFVVTAVAAEPKDGVHQDIQSLKQYLS